MIDLLGYYVGLEDLLNCDHFECKTTDVQMLSVNNKENKWMLSFCECFVSVPKQNTRIIQT